MWGREFDDPWSVSSRAHRAITWVILQHTGSDEHRQVKRMSHMRPDVLFHVANQIAASIAAAMAPYSRDLISDLEIREMRERGRKF